MKSLFVQKELLDWTKIHGTIVWIHSLFKNIAQNILYHPIISPLCVVHKIETNNMK